MKLNIVKCKSITLLRAKQVKILFITLMVVLLKMLIILCNLGIMLDLKLSIQSYIIAIVDKVIQFKYFVS